MKKICVVGQGFAGSTMSLACARALSKKKIPLFKVYGLELKNKKSLQIVNSINKGIFPHKSSDKKIDLEMKKVFLNKNYLATINKNIISNCDIIIININLDVTKNKKKEITNFKKTIKNIGKLVRINSLILIESTVPPGFCENIIRPLINTELKKRRIKGNSIYLAHSYERVMPGKNYLDSIINQRRVFAGENSKASNLCKKFLSSIINVKRYPLTRLKKIISSETSKILENTYRAVNIALIDEWTKFADVVGIDLYEIINAIKKRKTHQNIRYPGLGVGGYCLTKDPLFADYSAKKIFKKKINFNFSKLAVKTNNSMPDLSCQKIKKNLKTLKNKKILIFGIAYKSDVGDTRQSPSLKLFEFIKRQKGKPICYDPYVNYWNEKKVNVNNNPKSTKKIDAAVFAVPHSKFRGYNLKRFSFNSNSYVLDASKCLSKKQISILKSLGCRVEILGSGI